MCKRLRTIALTAGLTMMLCLGGCGQKEVETTESVAVETVAETKETSKLSDYLKGLADVYVEVGNTQINYLDGLSFDKKKISSIEVDDSKVNTKQAGVYTLRYILKGIRENGKVPSETVTAKVHVVKAEEAKKLADNGVAVETDEGVKKNSKGEEVVRVVDTQKSSDGSSSGAGVSGSGSGKPSNSGSANSGGMRPGGSGKPSNSGSTGSSSGSGNNTKPSGSTGNSGSGSTGSNTSKPSNPVETKPSKPSGKPETPETKPSETNPPETQHKHTWVDKYNQVYHEEESHMEDRVVQEAWTETVETPVYGWVEYDVCPTCGWEGPVGTGDAHIYETEHGNYYGDARWEQTGTEVEYIEHAAVTEPVKVVDREAWTENAYVGTYCSECGAKK